MPVEDFVYFPEEEEFEYRVDLSGEVYRLRWVWRERARTWYLTVYTQPTPQEVTADPEATGTPLGTKAVMPGMIFAVPGVEGFFIQWGDDTQIQGDLGTRYGILFAFEEITT